MAGKPRKPTIRSREQQHADRLKIMRQVCERLADGESLSSICNPKAKEVKKIIGCPTRTVVLRWVSDYQDIRDMYARAKQSGVEIWGDELRGIAVGVLQGGIDPNAGRVGADIMKWTMARLAPRRWSDRAIEEAFQSQDGDAAAFEYRGIPADLIGPSFGQFLHDVRADAATH